MQSDRSQENGLEKVGSDHLDSDQKRINAQAADASAKLDRIAHAAIARMSGGISPVSLSIAYAEWGLGLATSPGTLWHLYTRAWEHTADWFSDQVAASLPAGDTGSDAIARKLEGDERFRDSGWQSQPWSAIATSSLAMERWLSETAAVPGVSDRSREKVRFYNRQLMDLLSPSNWPLSNPEVIRKFLETGGETAIKGARLAAKDWRKRLHRDEADDDIDALRPGAGLAMTPGKVVMRNHLVELIQYTPTTDTVFAEPLLIIPSCIMKYYILDLSEHNSMVRWLVDQGHTVFILSWRNPDESDAALTLDDYVSLGVLEALRFVAEKLRQPVHLVGYCLGGTFAAIAAAHLQKQCIGSPDFVCPLASLTLLAAETDFSEPGELGVLIDDAQVHALEAMMAAKGYLTGRQMAMTFQFLHARDLVWSNRTKSYLLGEPAFVNDLVSWNADVTRLPATMHGQYLRRLYLRNELAHGKYSFLGTPVSLRDIHVPMFVVGTEKDHVSPWKSVYKIHQLVSGEVTFVLTNGGHNAGILSEPGHAGRHYRMHCTKSGQPRLTPSDWVQKAEHRDGSWWELWGTWVQRDAKAKQRAHAITDGLCDAPGEYVMVRYDD